MTPSNWSLGTLIAVPIGIFFFVALGALTGWLFAHARKETDSSDKGFLYSFAVMALVVTLFVGFGTFWSEYPWKSSYHRYYQVTGKVTQVGSSQVAADSSMYTRYVFTINGTKYGLDDARGSLVKPGDTVSLKCKREYVYGSTDNGWACVMAK
jgi:hypothetical protein